MGKFYVKWNDESVEEAIESHYKQLGYETAELAVEDTEDMSFPDLAYDIILKDGTIVSSHITDRNRDETDQRK